MKTHKIGLILLGLIIAGLTLVSTVNAAAVADEKPPALQSQLREIHSKGWYEQQFKSWSGYLAEMEGAEASDWLEYYKSAEYARKSQHVLVKIADQITTRFSGSFEDHFVRAKLAGWTDDGIAHLTKAIELSPSPDQLLAEKMMLAEVEMNSSERKVGGAELFESGIIYPSLLSYSYNVLMSVGENGVLFVQGLSTTIPLWILQDEMGVRQDVKVLNLDLAKNIAYMQEWLRKNGLKSTGSSLMQEDLIMDLPERNPEVEFYYGLTLPSTKLTSLEDQLYVVGLASLRKSRGTFDHYGTLKYNIEERFLLDYLTIDFSGEPKSSTGRVYETNYILPFLLLKEYYDETGAVSSSREWKEMILLLAERSQIKNRVALLMERNKTNGSAQRSFAKTDIKVKDLDKKMKQIKDNLYASNVELTNREYWFYLNYLNKNGYADLYEMSQAQVGNYDEMMAQFFKNYNYSPANYISIYENKKKKSGDYLDYPALDMTHEAAKAYCEWLTAQYNQQDGRKYKKVLFRLPSQKEWQIAALGYKEFQSWNVEEVTVKAYAPDNWSDKSGTKKDPKLLKEYSVKEANILYPWWYPNIRFASKVTNQYNCYLANVKAPEEITCANGKTKGDGFTLMSPVGTYFANQMELYDVVGNIAEMIDQPGKAMGGSWNHVAEESTIRTVNEYNNSDITVGFRLFMEVIEE